MIDFLDVRWTNTDTADEIDSAVRRVMASGRYILGPELATFEDELAVACGSRYAVGVGNGLDALALTLQAAGVGPGDEVIVPSNTFIATWLAVTRVGARPVPVEPDASTCNVDPDLVEAAIGPRTAAIVPVHLYGQPADMARIEELAERRGLLVVADAAQAVGATLRGKGVGAFGTAATLSFYPGKNLGAIGDGGAVLTSDPALAERVRRLRNYGSDQKYVHEELGTNSRLDELQAAILRAKLRKLPQWTARRRAIADRYQRALVGGGVVVPHLMAGTESAWHLYVVRHPRRDALASHLADRGIQTLIHYPIPPHRQACYPEFAHEDLPIAERLSAEVLSLPMGPHLTADDVAEVIDGVRSFDRPG